MEDGEGERGETLAVFVGSVAQILPGLASLHGLEECEGVALRHDLLPQCPVEGERRRAGAGTDHGLQLLPLHHLQALLRQVDVLGWV